jgi:hypothetical protein
MYLKRISIRLAILILILTSGAILGRAFAGRPRAIQKVVTKRAEPPGLADALAATREKHRAESLKWRGTALIVHPDARGDVLKLHQQIVADFARLDPKIPSRLDHYSWLSTDYDTDVTITGWWGQVADVTPQDDHCLVTIKVSPYIHAPNRGGVALIPRRTEYYRYVPATHQLTYVDAEPRPEGEGVNSVMID